MSTLNKFHFRSVFIASWSAFLMLATLLVFIQVQGYGVGQSKNRTSQTGTVAGSASTSLLALPVQLKGNKEIAGFTLTIPDALIERKETLKVSYDLHGLCVLDGPAASIELQQANMPVLQIPFASAGKNCHQGLQSVDIPFESYSGKITGNTPIELSISIWYPTVFSAEIRSVVSYNAGSAVLGVSISETSAPIRKTFDHILPIRPEPFVRTDIQEE